MRKNQRGQKRKAKAEEEYVPAMMEDEYVITTNAKKKRKL